MRLSVAEIALALSSSVELSILTKATLVMVFGLAAVWCARRARASVRHFLLATTFAVLLVLPIAIVFGPGFAIEVPIQQPSNFAANATVSTDTLANPVLTIAAPADIQPNRWAMPSWQPLVRSVWFAGAIFLVLPLALDLKRVGRVLRNGLPSMRLNNLAQAVATECGLRRRVTVLLHEDVQAPLTWRSVIVLPFDAGEWTEENLRRALVHELEHARRFDWVTQLLARAVCCFYWFHPLVWMIWRQLRLEAERTCDDAVIENADRTDYAEQLVLLSRQLSTVSAQSVLGMANRSDLSRRVSALLDERQRRGPTSALAAASVILVAIVCVLSIGPLRATAQNPPSTNTNENRSLTALDRALYDAAEEGNTSDIKRLLDAGANVNAVLQGDGSPLIGAAREGHLAAVTLLLDRGADPNMPVRGDGNPLIMAAGEGHTSVVELLLNRGAHIDQVVPGDENALIQASGNGHLAVVKLLVSRGANVNARVFVERGSRAEGEWRSPLSMARKEGHSEVVAFLLSSGAQQ